MPLICEACHAPTRRVILQETGRLYCPGCHAHARDLTRGSSTAIVRDDIPGGVTVENYGPTPLTFYSHSERRRYMAAHGLHEKEKWCPMPGTDIDPQGIPNPNGYMDPYTLESARVLLSRNGAREDPLPPDPTHGGMLRETFEGHLTPQDAQAIAAGDPVRQSRLYRRIHGDH